MNWAAVCVCPQNVEIFIRTKSPLPSKLFNLNWLNGFSKRENKTQAKPKTKPQNHRNKQYMKLLAFSSSRAWGISEWIFSQAAFLLWNVSCRLQIALLKKGNQLLLYLNSGRWLWCCLKRRPCIYILIQQVHISQLQGRQRSQMGFWRGFVCLFTSLLSFW